MLAYMMVHGGPLPSFLSPLAYSIIAEGSGFVKATPKHIVDYELQASVEQVSISDMQ